MAEDKERLVWKGAMNLVIPLTNYALIIIIIILGNVFWQPHTIEKGKNLLWMIPASMHFM